MTFKKISIVFCFFIFVLYSGLIAALFLFLSNGDAVRHVTLRKNSFFNTAERSCRHHQHDTLHIDSGAVRVCPVPIRFSREEGH